MAHTENLEHLSLEERKFNEYVQLGDNFMQIQIYYLADSWYEKAVGMQPENKEALQKWEHCREKHRKENLSIYVVVGIMAAIVLAILGVKFL